MAPMAALICDVPCATPVARPPALSVATAALEVDQVTDPVTFCVLASVYVPVAVNWRVAPLAMVGLAGVSAIDTSAAGPTVSVVLPVMAPEVALICAVPCAAPLASPLAETVAVAVFDDAH